MKKLVAALGLMVVSIAAQSATTTPAVQCDNTSLKGDYVAQIQGVKDGNSISGEYRFTFDGTTEPTNQSGRLKASGFDSKFYSGTTSGHVDGTGLYVVYNQGCAGFIIFSPTGKTEDNVTVNVHLDQISILKKPYSANHATGAFNRDDVGYTFNMTRWGQLK